MQKSPFWAIVEGFGFGCSDPYALMGLRLWFIRLINSFDEDA